MLQDLVIFAVGMWAGAINVTVGSGALVTFPTLLFFGYPPLVANISNNIGVVPGGLSGIHGYRRELRGNLPILLPLVPASILGGVIGALLLFVLPSSSFRAVVPLLIAVGVVMVIVGPWVQRRTRERDATTRRPGMSRWLRLWVGGLGVYGGYFGAAQGVLLTGVMGLFLAEELQRITAIKNVLATAVNATAALTFILFARHHIDWSIVALIASGSIIGGQVGSRYGRRLPAPVLRALIVVIGVTAITKLVFFD